MILVFAGVHSFIPFPLVSLCIVTILNMSFSDSIVKATNFIAEHNAEEAVKLLSTLVKSS